MEKEYENRDSSANSVDIVGNFEKTKKQVNQTMKHYWN